MIKDFTVVMAIAAWPTNSTLITLQETDIQVDKLYMNRTELNSLNTSYPFFPSGHMTAYNVKKTLAIHLSECEII